MWSSPLLLLVLFLGVGAPHATTPASRTSDVASSRPNTVTATTTVLSGLVRVNQPVLVPLTTPGRWRLSHRGALSTRLWCGGDAARVTSLVTVVAGSACQLELSSPQVSTWTLRSSL